MRSGRVRSGAVRSCDEQWSCDECGVRSGEISGDEKWTCEKWSCDEL